jgi:hypothetical protein
VRRERKVVEKDNVSRTEEKCAKTNLFVRILTFFSKRQVFFIDDDGLFASSSSKFPNVCLDVLESLLYCHQVCSLSNCCLVTGKIRSLLQS